MLTDSGVNAMSDQQLAAMMVADDSYAGSATFTRLENKLNELFGMPHFLPAHQGRACEHIIASTRVHFFMDARKECHVRAGKNALSNFGDVFLQRRVCNHLCGLEESGINHF